MTTLKKHIFLLAIVALFVITSCQQPGGNTTGSEFMPDMGHSVAYESNYYNYYYNNTWGSEDEYYAYAQPRVPVNGTIPRGYAKEALQKGSAPMINNENAIQIPMNGSVPYYYDDTEEGRLLATSELVKNPYPITDSGLSRGKELYDVFCAICHGDKGDGAGYLVRDDGGVYPVQPAILINEEFTNDTNGRLYHAIVYGKNLMGGYADKVSYEERWQIVHYIRSLQAKEFDKEYNQYNNTLNEIDHPAGDIMAAEVTMIDDGKHATDDHPNEEHHNDGSH